MTYFISPVWFYMLGLAENARFVFGAVLFLAIVCDLIYARIYLSNAKIIAEYGEERCEKEISLLARIRSFKTPLVLTTVISLLFVSFFPSKETLIEMMVASVATKENAAKRRRRSIPEDDGRGDRGAVRCLCVGN